MLRIFQHVVGQKPAQKCIKYVGQIAGGSQSKSFFLRIVRDVENLLFVDVLCVIIQGISQQKITDGFGGSRCI